MRVLSAVVLLAAAVVQSARADYMVDFVKAVCIPEAGFVDLEYRAIHSVTFEAIPEGRRVEVWTKSGFVRPNGPEFKCSLNGHEYKVLAKQARASPQGQCGASPEVKMSVLRDGKHIISDAVFGQGLRTRMT